MVLLTWWYRNGYIAVYVVSWKEEWKFPPSSCSSSCSQSKHTDWVFELWHKCSRLLSLLHGKLNGLCSSERRGVLSEFTPPTARVFWHVYLSIFLHHNQHIKSDRRRNDKIESAQRRGRFQYEGNYASAIHWGCTSKEFNNRGTQNEHGNLFAQTTVKSKYLENHLQQSRSVIRLECSIVNMYDIDCDCARFQLATLLWFHDWRRTPSLTRCFPNVCETTVNWRPAQWPSRRERATAWEKTQGNGRLESRGEHIKVHDR